jgi:hypothetical protein
MHPAGASISGWTVSRRTIDAASGQRRVVTPTRRQYAAIIDAGFSRKEPDARLEAIGENPDGIDRRLCSAAPVPIHRMTAPVSRSISAWRRRLSFEFHCGEVRGLDV